VFDEYCEVSSVMGVIDWYEARNMCGKVFWFFLLFFSISFTTYSIYGSTK